MIVITNALRLKMCQLVMYSTITDVKEISIYVSEHACVPKMQLVKFIRLEIFKINEEIRALSLEGN